MSQGANCRHWRAPRRLQWQQHPPAAESRRGTVPASAHPLTSATRRPESAAAVKHRPRHPGVKHQPGQDTGTRAVLALVLLLTATVHAQLVERVVDGDTIVVQGVGKVRLIGVDTPELGDSRPDVAKMARSAAAFVEQTVGGRQVRLDYDWQRRDKYGRTGRARAGQGLWQCSHGRHCRSSRQVHCYGRCR